MILVMRKLLFLVLFLPIIVFAQTKQDLFYLIDKFPVNKSGDVDFCIIDSVKNSSKGVIYIKAIQVIDHCFKNAPSTTIPLYDDVNNIIIYKGKFIRFDRTQKTFSTVLNTYIYRFTLKIECMDNAYKLSIYDISESEGDFTILLSDLLKKEYYEKMKLSAGSLKAKYNSILFIYNYLTSKIKSVREYLLKENVQIKSKQPE